MSQNILMIVNHSIIKLYENSSFETVSDELLFGHEFRIISSTAFSFKIETLYGYQGYIKKEGFSFKPSFFSKRLSVCSKFADVYPSFDILKEPCITLFSDSIVYVLEESEKWYKIHLGNGLFGYINKKCVCECAEIFAPYGYMSNIEESKDLRDRLRKSAFSFYGTQYRWGGKSIIGIDCSGLCFMKSILS